LSPEENIKGILTLSPIRDDPDAAVPPSLTIQIYLASLARGNESPFAKVPGTHMARLSVLDDVARVTPAIHDHLSTAFLLFEANFDRDAETYLRQMTNRIPDVVETVWGSCIGFPGVANTEAFLRYMKQCTIDPVFRFTGSNKKTVEETLSALRTQSAVLRFIRSNQGKSVEELRRQFSAFSSLMRGASEGINPVKQKEYRDA
jgi:hypothetical protein